MGDREFTEFDTALTKSNRLLNELEEEMGWENRRSQTYAAFRETMYAIRDLLLPDEALHLAAQLPPLLAGIFINGWKPSKTPMRMSKDEFFQRIQANLQYDVDVNDLVGAIWRVLENNISEGELRHVMENLPNDIAQAIKDKSLLSVV